MLCIIAFLTATDETDIASSNLSSKSWSCF